MRRLLERVAAAVLLCTAAAAQQATTPSRTIFEVEIANPLRGDPVAEGPFSGRLIVRLSPSKPGGLGMPAYPAGATATPEQQKRQLEMREALDNVNFARAARRPFPGLFAAAMDVSGIMPGDVIKIDVNKLATPAPFSTLPRGQYFATAVLDIHDDFAVTNSPQEDDLSSPVQRITLGGAVPRLAIQRANYPAAPWGRPMNAQMAAVREATRDVDFISPSLSAFRGKPTHIRGYVLLPPGYGTNSETYPVVYDFGPFGWTSDMMPVFQILQRHAPMYGGAFPPMVWVVLEPSGPSGAHGFVDSANYGPWSKALAEELIPWLEKQYRVDGKASARFLFGDGAGGWTALWLQAKYPRLFGGAWAKSPDPVDFRDFFGTDIYAADANLFADGSGAHKVMFREQARFGGDEVYTVRDVSGLETVYGPRGQFATFEGMFSPKGADGKPKPLFNRSTGVVDAAVAQQWGEHYDLSRYIAANWPALKDDLEGKLHIAIGGWDTAGRQRAVERLKQTLDSLGAKADINVMLGRTENDLYVEPRLLVSEVYRLARPDSTWTAPQRGSAAALPPGR